MFELDSKRSRRDVGVPGDIWVENGDVEWSVFVEIVCVLCLYGSRVILRGDLTVDKCLNWILREVGEMSGFQVIFG